MIARMDARAAEIALASRSPRRRSLLAEHGFTVLCLESGIEDDDLERGRATPAEWAVSLAYLKARAAADKTPSGWTKPVLGADTTCVLDGECIGKPRDERDAARILTSFVGRSHEVITGVAVLREGGRILFADRAVVTLGELPRRELDAYLESGLWRGKAGAYNLSERIEAGWPITHTGDWTTIVGLPMGRLVPLLARTEAAA